MMEKTSSQRIYSLPEPSKYETKKQRFLEKNSKRYGYRGNIEEIRETEYPQMKGSTYLDHSGATTYATSVLSSFKADLSSHLYGNPHSQTPSSQLSTERTNAVRNRVLKHFNADPEKYEVIFTSNATGAIKMVGESFPWRKGKSTLTCLREGHTSLIGMRRFALESMVTVHGVTEYELEANFDPDMTNNPYFNNDIPMTDEIPGVPEIPKRITYNLFTYPAQCNYSGMRFPLEWIRKIKQNFNTENEKTLVLLDAAAYATSSTLSLANTENSPDFMVVSFYKLFGYPTGLGACIVKKELGPIMIKRYFGGGTVSELVWNRNFQGFRQNLHERYEDGTINFLDIIALDHAFDTHKRLYKSFGHIRKHVTSLISYLYKEMSQLQHWNGAPVCHINSDRDFKDSRRQGPVLSFNVLRADGTYAGYNEIEKLAGSFGIHVRVGTHCNPGSVERWNSLTTEELESRKCGGDCDDLTSGKPYGAVRISLGAMSTIDDILVWLDFLKTLYVDRGARTSSFKRRSLGASGSKPWSRWKIIFAKKS